MIDFHDPGPAVSQTACGEENDCQPQKDAAESSPTDATPTRTPQLDCGSQTGFPRSVRRQIPLHPCNLHPSWLAAGLCVRHLSHRPTLARRNVRSAEDRRTQVGSRQARSGIIGYYSTAIARKKSVNAQFTGSTIDRSKSAPSRYRMLKAAFDLRRTAAAHRTINRDNL